MAKTESVEAGKRAEAPAVAPRPVEHEWASYRAVLTSVEVQTVFPADIDPKMFTGVLLPRADPAPKPRELK
jgi:hypothetical protein